jgi:aquaporin Z
MVNTVRKYVAEFVGTFTLVFIGTAVATLQGFLDQGPVGWIGISLAFGFTLGVLVLVVGPVSGCHINPAVTLPMAASGRLSWSLVPGYLLSQLAGATAASLALLALLQGIPGYDLTQHGLGANGNPLGASTGSLFGWELLMTALFLFTIFAATRGDAPAGFAAIAIGGFLFVAHLVGAPLGDSSLNPARSLGPALFVKGAALKILPVFLIAPVIGGLIGWQIYKIAYDD